MSAPASADHDAAPASAQPSDRPAPAIVAANGPADGPPDKPVNRLLVFCIVALALMMMSINSTIVATALHALQQGLHTSINWAGWTITAYSVGFVVMLPVIGKLSERHGHYRVFFISLIAFTLASLLCGLVNDIYALIALRALQAAGGAGFTPSATGIIVKHFGDARDRAVGLFGSIFPIGAMIGPIFGGILVDFFSWRSVFFVNVPLGLVAIVLVYLYVPRDRQNRAQEKFPMDLLGMLLLGTGMLAGMLTASYLGEINTLTWSPILLLPLLLCIFCLWTFARHIRRAAHPFITPRLLTGPGFGAINLVNLLIGGVTSGSVTLIPLYAINRYGFSALDSGTLLVAQGIAAIVFSVSAAFLLRRTGYRLPIYVGSAAVAAGLALLAMQPVGDISPYVWLAGSAFLVGAGGGSLNPASRNAGLQLAPRRSSTIAAIRSMGMASGGIITISLATAILSASHDPGSTHAWIYMFTAVLILAVLPIISRVPEHHGSW